MKPYNYVIAILIATCCNSATSLSQSICRNAYVWNFLNGEGKQTNETRMLTDFIESNLTDQQNCKMLVRREFSQNFEAAQNEREILSLSDIEHFKTQLRTEKADIVVFGKLTFDEISDKYILKMQFQEIETAILLRSKTTTIPRPVMRDVDKLRAATEAFVCETIAGKNCGQATMSPQKPPTGKILWQHNTGRVSIWTVDQVGDKNGFKERSILEGWDLVNCSNGKALWQHNNGQISLWNLSAEGDLLQSKEHGPIGGWTAINFANNKILWRHSSGKISLWSVDADGNVLRYKEHGPIGDWKALYYFNNKIVWQNGEGRVSIWTVDDEGNSTGYKEHNPIPGWALVNCAEDKILWRHTSGKISLWTVDAFGGVPIYKEHGPLGGWTALNYEGNKILWRHSSGKISLWNVDNVGNSIQYKEHGPIGNWKALYFTQ